MDKRTVDGYKFGTDEDYKMAQEELKKINYISEKLDIHNVEGVYQVYNKCIQGSVFVTPVGVEFLKGMQTYLKKSDVIPENEIPDIPLRFSYADALALKQNKRFDSIGANKEKPDFRPRFLFSLIVNGVLFVMVIIMFVIALSADNPNIINYKNAIENKYASWEQDLTERENELRIKEAEIKRMTGERDSADNGE